MVNIADSTLEQGRESCSWLVQDILDGAGYWFPQQNLWNHWRCVCVWQSQFSWR